MKERFVKVVETDKEVYVIALVSSVIAIVLSITGFLFGLSEDIREFLRAIFLGFAFGFILTAIFALLNYYTSRKVYWEKVK